MDSLRVLLCHADWISKRMIVVFGGLFRSKSTDDGHVCKASYGILSRGVTVS